MILDNLKGKTIGLWAIRSEEDVGLGKLLRKNYPVNQIDLLQILTNGGVATKMIFKSLDNNIIATIQVLWDKHITQKELRLGVRLILGKLSLELDIELAVMSIHKDTLDPNIFTNEAVDIIEPNDDLFQDKILKWQMIQNWNNHPDTNQWAKYDHLTF